MRPVPSDPSADADAGPVTVVVTRRVRAGCEAAYEAWLQRLLASASTLPGYLGATITRPSPGAPREYTSVFRFDSVAHLRAFEASDLRRRALLEVVELVEADAVSRQFTGLEFWFTPPPGILVPQPSRWRMALLMIIVVYVLVLSIGQLVGLVLATAPVALRLLVTIVLEVALMTWVLMPRLTRWLSRWIYPSVRAT
jgi:antibiotic biosynthesis monooxygenase (ABM) superfamily enzyme